MSADRCDQAVYQHGRLVFTTTLIPSEEMEAWVRKVAEKSGQAVDWHIAGGSRHVKSLGGYSRVRAAMLALRPEHDRLWMAAALSILGDHQWVRDLKPPFDLCGPEGA